MKHFTRLKRLLVVMEKVAKMPKHAFNHNIWVVTKKGSDSKRRSACNTTACIGGWASCDSILSKEGIKKRIDHKIDSETHWDVLIGKEYISPTNASEFFGISLEEARMLFFTANEAGRWNVLIGYDMVIAKDTVKYLKALVNKYKKLEILHLKIAKLESASEKLYDKIHTLDKDLNPGK